MVPPIWLEKCKQIYPKIFTDLTLEAQEEVLELIFFMQEKVLLTEQIVYRIALSKQRDPITSLILILSDHDCLDNATLASLLNISDFNWLYYNFTRLINNNYSAEACIFIFDMLALNINLPAFKATLELFQLSNFNYLSQPFSAFLNIMQILSNPLCQIIFKARLSCFSTDALTAEPLTTNDADTILIELSSSANEENKISNFFNYLARFRRFSPMFQLLDETLDCDNQVNRFLSSWCFKQVNSVTTRAQYLQLHKLIATLQQKGADNELFSTVKYKIASQIVNKDLYSTWTYEKLMSEIKKAISKPQPGLDYLVDILNSSKFNQSAVDKNSFFSQADEKKLILQPTDNYNLGLS